MQVKWNFLHEIYEELDQIHCNIEDTEKDTDFDSMKKKVGMVKTQLNATKGRLHGVLKQAKIDGFVGS